MDKKKYKTVPTAVISCILIVFLFSGGISAYTWKPVVVPAGGAIQDVVFSRAESGLMYIRTDMGGAYRKDNGSSLWIPLTDWLDDWNLYGVESIAPDPVNSNVVYAALGQTYAGTNGAFIASNDRGNTWTQYPLPFMCGANNSGNYAGERLAIDPNLRTTLYFGSRLNGLWKSTNSGAAWNQVTSFPVNGDSGNGLSYVILDKNSGTTGNPSQTIYVGVQAVGSGNSNLYRSTNGGTTWSLISGGPSGMSSPQASLGTDGNLWLVYNNVNSGPTTGQIWKLSTGTLAWSNITPSAGPPAGAGGYAGISVDNQNAQHAVVSTTGWWGGTDKCFQTTNGGTSWTIIANAQNSWNSGPYPIYDINGAVWTRFCSIYDGGAWFISCVQIDPFNSNNSVYSTGGGIWTTTNVLATLQPQGITWTFTDYGIEQTAVIFLLPSYKGGVFFSCLGDISGMRYTNLDAPAPNKYCNPHVGNNLCLDFAENNVNVVARVGHSGTTASDTAFSADNGQNWAPGATAPPGYGTSNQMRSCAVAANGSRVLVCPNTGYGNSAYTTNSGSSWTTCNGLPSGSDLASDRVNASVFFATNGSNLYLSTDGGANFSIVNNFSGSGAPRPVFGLTGEVWVATGNGLYRFTNNGSTKTTISNVPGANSVGFGKAAPGQSHPAVYLSGTVGSQRGFFRCDDGVGTSWLRINDNAHQYGYAGWCGGDQEVYGRMYIGTNGRGTLYCDSGAGTATPTTTGTPPTATRTGTITRTYTITPTYTLTPVQCNDVKYSGETPYNLASGGSYIGTSGTVSEVTTQYHSASHSMQVHFVWADGWYQGMAFNWANWNAAGTYNASSATALSMWLKSDSGTINTLAVSLGDSAGGGTNSIQVTTYLAGGVTTTWQELKIPLSAFTGADMSLLWELRISTGGSQAGDQAFYLDDLSFVNACGTPTFTATVFSSPTYTRTTTRTATPTFTRTMTLTLTRTATGTNTATGTGTPTGSPTNTVTRTRTATHSATASMTPTVTASVTPSYTNTRTPSATASVSPTNSNTRTPTYTRTPTNSNTRTPTYTRTPTGSRTPTIAVPSATFTHTGTPVPPTVTFTSTGTPTYTRTVTGSPSASATSTSSAQPTSTNSVTPANTYTRSPTNTPASTFTYTRTNTPTFTRTGTPTGTYTAIPTGTFTRTPTGTFTRTPTGTFTRTQTGTFTRTPTGTFTRTPTGTYSETPSITATWTPGFGTVTITPTVTRTPTATRTSSVVPSFTITVTNTMTLTRTPTFTRTSTPSFIETMTFTRTRTPTATPVHSATGTESPVPSATFSRTRTATPVNTATRTRTDTPVVSHTNTPAGTLTNTPVVTVTNTPANTATRTATATATATNTQVNTVTNTPLNTSTNTVLPTSSNTPVNTITNSPTLMPTASYTSTSLPSATYTFTTTVTPSFTLTVTNTFTRTFTATVTRTLTPLPTGTATATQTCTPVSGPLALDEVIIYPNPYNPNKGDLRVGMTLAGQVVKLNVRVYTVSYRRIIEETENITASGEITLSLAGRKFGKLACGAYFIVISGEAAGGEKAVSKLQELIILK